MHSDVQPWRFCRVCGYEPASPPWGEDGRSPTFEICPSCGAEYGYNDATLAAVLRYRDRWLKAGGHWYDPQIRPDGLSVETRLSRVPEAFR